MCRLFLGTWSRLWFAGVRECPPWCSIVGATVTVHQFFCILHVFMKHGCPDDNQVKTGKISKSQILTLPHFQGHVMSGECEQPLDELNSLSLVIV